MNQDYRAWLYTMDREELEAYAMDCGVNPINYPEDEALIEAVVKELESA